MCGREPETATHEGPLIFGSSSLGGYQGTPSSLFPILISSPRNSWDPKKLPLSSEAPYCDTRQEVSKPETLNPETQNPQPYTFNGELETSI